MRANARRNGFTLIELLIVLVILGVLATFAMTFLWNAKDRALLSSMKSDLKTVATQQEEYFETRYSYAPSLADLGNFAPSPGVVLAITYSAHDGWAGTATHPSAGTGQCGILIGEAPVGSADPADVAGVVRCTD
jgi:prepilin-type N-terminal cleavage/methylation domain-containing protein